ncbi:PREDICTED: gamma-tubulin complex component 6-like [Condylura cristata]|uniref:gamma-tubulin complex component 6-like n=1 Tax=Condylura cristata TaxID=143302 RepID=UPI000642AA37|nr:PREDICTED: gamma-tubulin complex component 6-like [Condylura cristata]
MEAAPGTGLPAVGLFSAGDPCGDGFDRDTGLSLFGALVHSRTWDMDVRLDLPPVPAGAALSALAVKVPRSVDQSEDEGFQSASNLTPDSQSELGLSPDVDLWDAALTYQASRRRRWEQVGCPPGHREEPYLTEAGRGAFDRFCRLRQGELQVLGGGGLLQTPQPVQLRERELVKDALNVLIGVVSSTFSCCQFSPLGCAAALDSCRTVSASARARPTAARAPQAAFVAGFLLRCHLPAGKRAVSGERRLCPERLPATLRFLPAGQGPSSPCRLPQAFTSGLRRYLQHYRACVLSTPPTLSLLALSFLFKRLGRQLR